jgi:hypothetical protein
MFSMLRTLLLATILIFLSACAAPTMHQVHLEEQGTQKDKLVHVTTGSPLLFLDAVDGKRSGDFRPFFAGPAAYAGFDLFLPSGFHTIDVWYGTGGGMYQATTKPVRLEFFGNPGQIFIVSHSIVGNMVQFSIKPKNE